MRSEVAAALLADAPLLALLPGGVHTTALISKQYTPSAFDANKELRPCALVKLDTDTPAGPYRTSAQEALTIYLYQRVGYEAIEPARLRIYTLLHRQRLAPTVGGAWQLFHAGDVLFREDAALSAALHVCRFTVVITKG